MADERIEDITGGELTAPTPDDLYVVLDASDTTDDPQGTVKNIKHQNVGGLVIGATKTADFTAAVGYLYPVDANNGGTGLSDNIDVTFPSTPTAGDTFGYFVNTQNVTDTGSSGFATAPFWGVDPVNATIINNESYTNAAGDGTEKWGLFINSELLIFRYVDATVGWQVIKDEINIHNTGLVADAAFTITTSSAFAKIANLGTVEFDVGGLADGTNDRLYIKRSGLYLTELFTIIATLGTAKRGISAVFVNGAEKRRGNDLRFTGSGSCNLIAARPIQLNAGDYVEMYVWQNDSTSEALTYVGSGAANDSRLAVCEQR